jgi:hypothetical protein
VFATTGWVNSLTDAAGRRRLLTFPPYVANLGYDPDHRVAQVHDIYCGGDPARSAALLRELGATYVVADGLPDGCATPTDFANPAFELAHEVGLVRIWRLADP